ARPGATAWTADLIRVTAFTSADAVVTPETWWKDVMGAEAEVETVRKSRLVRQDQGDALGGLLTLTVQPGRIDWVLGAKVPQKEPLPDFIPTLGPVVDSGPQLLELLTARWLPSCPPVDRLALGVNALVPVQGHQEAYELL